jgi:CHAT domain-containing protein/Tfp pilus assembly protein PilF
MLPRIRALLYAAVVGFLLASPSHAAKPAKAPQGTPPLGSFEATKILLQATYYINTEKFGKAIPLMKSLSKHYEVTFGKRSTTYIRFIASLGLLHSRTGDFKQGRAYLAKALALQRQVDGTSLTAADLLDSFGVFLQAEGELDDARGYLEQALAIYKRRNAKSLRAADVLNNLGVVLTQQGQLLEGRHYNEEALAIYEELAGSASPKTAMMLSNLGESMRLMGEFNAAQIHFEKALAIQDKNLRPNRRYRGIVLHNYATLLAQLRQYEAARARFAEAIKIDEEVSGNSTETAAAYGGLGMLCFWMRDFPAAQQSYERALEIESKVHGPNSLNRGYTLVNLGNLFSAQNRYEEARQNFEQGLAIYRVALGERHPNIARTLICLAMLEAKLGRWDQASELADKSRRIVRWNSLQILPALAEREQLAYLAKNDQADWHAGLSIGLARSDDARLTSLSATWLLNGKGSAQEASARRVLAARKAADTQTSDLLKRLLDVQVKLTKLDRIPLNAENTKNQQALISELLEEEGKLTRRLGEVGVVPTAADPWIALDTVRASLPDKTVFVNVIRLLVPRLQEAIEKATPRYVAWVIPKTGGGDVKIVDLGPASAIDEAVARVRQDIQNQAETKSLEELSRLVYAPLSGHLQGADRWIVSPDGSLWLIPWQALLIGNGQYAIERHEISYVMSGRELVKSKDWYVSQEPGLAMANPDFSLTLEPSIESPLQVALGGTRSGPAGTLPEKWPPLPGTAQEINSTLPRITSYLGKKPQVFIGAAATEAAFKRARQPRVAVLSTHGFFSPEQEAEPPIDDPTKARSAPSLRFDNPLLRTGLALAGANRHGRQTADEAVAAADDGILTGLEIVGADLRGTELVVLSACDSGLGDLHAGQGVAGLRHAFQLAGADAVLATLWKIPDTETAWLMDGFWQNLAAGDSKAKALRKAQLKILYARNELKALAARTPAGSGADIQRGEGGRVEFDPARIKPPAGHAQSPRPGLAAPIYWAAFTLTGQ